MKAKTNNAKRPTLATSNGVTIKADAKLANEAHKVERARVLGAIDTAEDLLGTALVEGLKMTARFGATSEDEVRANWTRCNSPAVYASWFNRGAKVAAIVGEKLALEAIDKSATTGKGAGFRKACDALKVIMDAAKEATGKAPGKAGCELSGRKAQAAVKSAVESAATAQEVRTVKEKAKRAPRAAASEPTMEAAAALIGKGHREMAGYILLASQKAHKLPAPEGREAAHKEAVAALAKAAELWQVFK